MRSSVGAVDQDQRLALARHEGAERGLHREGAAALERTATRSPPPAMSASRRRTRAVMAMNAASREPQSASIARRVLSAVVRGPGVSSNGSRARWTMGSPGGSVAAVPAI